ncbi:catalase-like [Cylas formicarius]|uniref:catalase-like n=1 Tax=Cylas formicarius TaxID=197179 RepID=UPI002958A639|nr:catalase-like [Cylas formicarius]
MSKRDKAANQLGEWYENNKENIGPANSQAGVSLINQRSSLTIGEYGPIPLADYNLLDQLGHFHRERIPERVVHAKGAGAFGYFEVTDDITQYTSANVFAEIGKQTPIAVRFSTVAGNLGSADSVRDPRGFAVKFYAEDGIWDLVGNNTPIFFMRDPILFPMFIHSQKRNPVTHLRDWDMFWDYLSLTPMSAHQVMFLFSDRGIPDGYRHMNGYGSHTFSLINKDHQVTWCKFIYKTDQGIKNLQPSVAETLAGKDPDYALRDLYNAIAEHNFPTWTFYVQVMTAEQARSVGFNPFDITKTWPHAEFPLIKVGKLVLNRNPTNYYADVEQIAFNPNNMPPGIGPSLDRLLQGRLFSYQDSHRYRLGVNYQQLSVNRTLNTVQNFQRDGFMAINNQGGAPNYHPNSFGGPDVDPNVKKAYPIPFDIQGMEDYYDNFYDEDNYAQARVFWEKVLDSAARNRLAENLAGTIRLARADIQERTLAMFENVHTDLGKLLKEKMGAKVIHM